MFNKIKRILILGAGGSPATNFVRSLKDSKEKFYIVGTDSNPYYLARAETDKKYLIPEAKNLKYLKVLNNIIKQEKIDFAHAQNDTEIGIISKLREKINVPLYLPSKKSVKICQNKWKSYQCWNRFGVPQPKTMKIDTPKKLKQAFKKLGKKIWIRETSGAGGKGSLLVSDFKQAKYWIDFHGTWNKFIAAEYLSPDTITWQSIWYNGELIVAQTRKRIYWELGKIAPSGISGATGAAITTSNLKVDKIARNSILAIDKKPHGIWSVDMCFNKKGVPIPTEINSGRFFTTHYFFTKAGLNMPEIFVKLAFNEKVNLNNVVNPLPDNLMWIRGMDFLPIFTSVKKIQNDKRIKK